MLISKWEVVLGAPDRANHIVLIEHVKPLKKDSVIFKGIAIRDTHFTLNRFTAHL